MANLGAIGWVPFFPFIAFNAQYGFGANNNGEISGVAEWRDPVTGIVQLFTNTKVSLVRAISREQLDVTTTDATDATFGFFNLPPGRYEIVISGNGDVRSKVFGPWTL